MKKYMDMDGREHILSMNDFKELQLQAKCVAENFASSGPAPSVVEEGKWIQEIKA